MISQVMPQSTLETKAFAFCVVHLLGGQRGFPLPTSPGRSVVVTEQFAQLNEHQCKADDELQRFVFAHGNSPPGVAASGAGRQLIVYRVETGCQ